MNLKQALKITLLLTEISTQKNINERVVLNAKNY